MLRSEVKTLDFRICHISFFIHVDALQKIWLYKFRKTDLASENTFSDEKRDVEEFKLENIFDHIKKDIQPKKKIFLCIDVMFSTYNLKIIITENGNIDFLK